MCHNWVASRKTRRHWILKEANKPGETRCNKSWDRFEEYDSLSLRNVKHNIRDNKGPSLEKIQVKGSHQGSPHAVKLEDRFQEKTERQQRCARSKAWDLVKNIYMLKEKDKTAFNFPAEEWVLPAASTKDPEEREFVVDSGASMHMVSKRDFNSAELETTRTSKNPTTVVTANSEVQTTEEATVSVKELDPFVTVMLLEETPATLSLGKLCVRILGILTTAPAVKNKISPKMARELIAISNYVPFVAPNLSTSSSTTPTPTSSSSSSQDSLFGVSRYTENLATERSGSMIEELRGNLQHKPTETKKQK